MSDEPEKMSINVFTSKREEIMKSDNSSNEYILKMNEELHNSNIELRIQMQEMKSQIEDLENELDKNDASLRYMRGVLKNYVELKLLYKSLCAKKTDYNKFCDKELKLSDEYINNYYNMIVSCMCMFLMSMLLFMNFNLISLESMLYIVISMVSSFGATYNYYDIDSEFKNINYNIADNITQNIKEEMKKIKEIEDGNDFLSEYINNI